MDATTLPVPKLATRHVGTCQICQNEQKLTADGRMVHHGYKRPGHGSIHGDCFGVDATPWEVSCAHLKTWSGMLARSIVSHEERLAHLTTGKVTELLVKEYVKGTYGASKPTMVAIDPAHPSWDSALRSAKSNAEYQIRGLTAEKDAADKRIAGWKPGTIKTVEEVVAQAQADKDARKVEREAARAARALKKAETRAKQEALQTRRASILSDFRTQLVLLSAEPASPARDEKANAIYAKLHLKKNNWFYVREIGALDAMVALGLATLTGGTNGYGEPCAKYHNTRGGAPRW